MRTNIDIDDELMRQAMLATGASTKKGAVEAALQGLVTIRAEEAGRREAIRLRKGGCGESAGEDWLDKWLASGWR